MGSVVSLYCCMTTFHVDNATRLNLQFFTQFCFIVTNSISLTVETKSNMMDKVNFQTNCFLIRWFFPFEYFSQTTWLITKGIGSTWLNFAHRLSPLRRMTVTRGCFCQTDYHHYTERVWLLDACLAFTIGIKERMIHWSWPLWLDCTGTRPSFDHFFT